MKIKNVCNVKQMYQYKKFKLFFWKQGFPSKTPTSWMECMYFKLWMMKMTIETESSEECAYELVKVSTFYVHHTSRITWDLNMSLASGIFFIFSWVDWIDL